MLPNSISGREISDSSYLNRAIKEFGGEGIIIVVEVENNILEADENSISFNNISYRVTREEILFYSMSFFGTCKYKGIIHPNKILGVYSKEGKH